MSKFFRNVFFLSILLLSTHAFAQPLQLVNAFPNLTFTRPLFVTHANDGTNRIFVVQQNGLIRVFPNDSSVTTARTFLNITNKLSSTGGEQGLLGLAFHPNYATNGYFYINYTAPSPLRTVVARYSVSPTDPNKADSLSEFIILQVNQPYSNHNGGMVFFGLDSYLYIGMGDGGSGCDPQNYAQNLTSLLGKILRINIDTVTATRNYGIPRDNPFYGNTQGYREEIWTWGMRNPWRMSLDPLTGQIWAGDVGQVSWEEIDLIRRGGNYGWRNYEGFQCGTCSGANCDTTGLVFPIKAYARTSPHCSVTGGYVYRGYRRPELVGRYIYGDYCSGYIWKFYYQNGQLTEDQLLIDAPFSISSFGVDKDGELYICNYSGGNIQRFAGNPNTTLTTVLVAPLNGSLNVPVPTELLWRTAAGAINYWIDIATDELFSNLVVWDSTLTDTVYTAGGLSTNVRYYWRVRAKSSAGWGNFTTPWFFTTGVLPARVSLIEPTNGSNVPSGLVTFRWRSATSATSYWFEMGFDSTFATVARRDTMLTDTSLTILDATPDTVYYWRVRGRSPAGFGPFSPRWMFTSYSLPVPPTLISPGDSSVVRPDTVRFVWESMQNIFNYWFDLSTDENFTTVVARDTTLTDTSKTLFNLSQLTWHYWRVRAKNRAGYGPFSSVRTFFTQEILDVYENKFLPQQFALHQNYPNPFNPSTQITYDIPKESYIRLSISNLLGQEVMVLYLGVQQAGRYSVEFSATGGSASGGDASGLASGVYFYTLETPEFRAVRKMILMR